MFGVLSCLKKAEEENWYLPRKPLDLVVQKKLRETEEKAAPGALACALSSIVIQ